MIVTFVLTLTLWTSSAQPGDMVMIHAPYTTTVLSVKHMPTGCMWNAPGWALACAASNERVVIEAVNNCSRAPLAMVVVRREDQYQIIECRCIWQQWLPLIGMNRSNDDS